MSVGQMYVSYMSVREMSVGQLSVREMSVGQLSGILLVKCLWVKCQLV